MAGPIKRLNYFDHQFLRAQDFSDEQTYHLEMRRLHNSLFHSWGIATGMQVTFTAGTSVASVAAGTALDAAGNEIVLVAAASTPDVSAMKSQTVFVTVTYQEAPSDPSTDAGASGNTRITETGVIAVGAPPADPSLNLVLACLVTDANGKITSMNNGVDPNSRRIAGASGADVQVHSLTLTDANNVVTTWPKLSVSAQASSSLTGNLAVAGNLTAGGAITATGALTSGAITCPGITVTGPTAVFKQTVEVVGALKADSAAAVTGNLTVGGSITATGSLASGAITCPGITVTTGPVNFGSTLGVTSNLTVGGAIRVNGTVSLGNASFQIDAPNVAGGRLTVAPNGNVGIGNANPAAPLHVGLSIQVNHAIQDQYTIVGYQFNASTANNVIGPVLTARGQTFFPTTSILAEGNIACPQFNAFSDARIKKNLSASSPSDALNLLNQLRVTDYQFKDIPAHGTQYHKGFIAEEVERFFPQAVSKRSNFIPDIYALAEKTTLDANVLTARLLDSHHFAEGDVVRLITETEGVKEVSVTVLDEKTFAVKDWAGGAGRLFVYGKKVDDFRTLDYQQIFSLGVSGLQQLSIEVDELKAANALLRERLQLLESKVQTAASPEGVVKRTNGNGRH
jgi:Chaperone of endosialidase